MNEGKIEEKAREREDTDNGLFETEEGETGWMKRKSQMLDEVNQLVELMTAEKSSLQDKILALESEVDQYHQQTEALRQGADKKDKDLSQLKFEQSLLKDKNSVQQKFLCNALHKTRRDLRSVQQELQSVTLRLEQERKCHSEVKSKLDSRQESHTKLSEKLRQQTAENKKLKDQLNAAQEQACNCQSHNDALQSQLNNSKQREKKSRDEILALRGRFTQRCKSLERLQAHCSVLEREIESRAQQAHLVKKTKEEIRLAKECRKKDDLLASYLHEISTCHEEHRTLQKEISQLQRKLVVEEGEKKLLSSKLEESVQKSHQLQRQLKSVEENLYSKRQQDEKAMSQRSLLVEKLHTLTSKLEISQRELSQLRAEVGRERERETERDKRKNNQVKQGEVENLRTQLEVVRREYQQLMEGAERQWQQRLRDAHNDYDRLKEASTRRCVELAKEVWELKFKLDSDRNS